MSRASKITLGIETSCDETALAILETRDTGAGMECRVIASLVHSQAELHSAYGGVFPTLAKREHGKNLVPLLHRLLMQARQLTEGDPGSATGASTRNFPTGKYPCHPASVVSPAIKEQNPELYESFIAAKFLEEVPNIDQIAVTEGPGLEPALWVGITFARMLSEVWNIPVTAVNHMEGHIVGSLLSSDIANGVWHKLHEAHMPAVALLISGGHTQLINVKSLGNYEIIGETVDDAVGEAFDKAARLMDLPYPGGPHLSMLASKALDEKIEPPLKLPRPMINTDDLNFSFSGLKTAVLYATRKAPRDAAGKLDETWRKGLALEFEYAVTETLDKKLRKAIEEIDAQSIIVGGGVSANRMIRTQLTKTATEYGIPLFLPSSNISGDNAIMIALAGALDSKTQKPESLRAEGTKRLGARE